MKKVIIVSGGSKGLGQGIVLDLLANGHQVATFSRSETSFIRGLVDQDPDEKNFLFRQIDATDDKMVRSFVTLVAQRFNRIDVLVNNAGVAVSEVLPLMQTSDIHNVLDLNLSAAIKLAQHCSRSMLIAGDGIIINISSIIGSRGYSGLSVYSATKAGMDGFTRALARELGPRGIRVNSIAPGYIDTDMSSTLSLEQKGQIIRRTPLGRLAKVEDITGVVEFLLSPAAAFITGQVITIDGGLTC